MNSNLILAELLDNTCKEIEKNIENLEKQKEEVKDIAIKDCISFKIHGYKDSKKILQDEFTKLCNKNNSVK